MLSAVKGKKLPAGSALARFFSPGVLADFGKSPASAPIAASRLFGELRLQRLCDLQMSVGAFYNSLFSHLVRDYRYEYVYKNAIAEKLFWGKHNLNTAFMLTEFRVANCKADAVVVNGTSHVYEIKTELDDFMRLESQLAAYARAFDFITVVTEERLYPVVEKRLPAAVGILTLADGLYQFRRSSFRREPQSNRGNLDAAAIFDSLTRPEYLWIIEQETDISLHHLPNTRIYTEARKLFIQLAPEVVHDHMVRLLKQRSSTMGLRDYVDKLPRSLKAASLSLRLNGDERERFVDAMNSPIGATLLQ